MDASKVSNAVQWRDMQGSSVPPVSARPTHKNGNRSQPGCGDVARKRAARYARKRRIPRLLWPLVAAFFLIGLIVERRPIRVFSGTEGKPVSEGVVMRSTSMPERAEWGNDRPPDPGTGSAVNGDPKPRYLPPSDFLATDKEIAQIVAFLIRNRGKLDTDPVRMKWEILDRVSLPLAIFLREVEATAAWDELDGEIKAAPPLNADAPSMAMLRSLWHRKIFGLLPEWSARGEELVSNAMTVEPSEEPAPGGTDKTPETDPPRP